MLRSGLQGVSVATLIGISGLACGIARGQDGQPVDAVTSAEMFELDGQPDLPGHERGARSPDEKKPAEAEPAPAAEARDWFGGKAWFEWETMTGDWAGARTKLADRGLEFGASYTMDWGSVWSGGLKNRASTIHMWDLNATFDLEKLAGLKGGTIFADGYFTQVRGGSRDVGDWHGVSNIDSGKNIGQLAELWYEQWMLDDHLRLKVGKIDGNAEFAFVNAAEETLNGSIAMPATAWDLPTFPNPATGVVLFVYPSARCYIGGGVFDGATADGWDTGNRGPDQFFSNDRSDAWFFIMEAGFTWDQWGGMGGGRVALGAHLHTADFPQFDGSGDEDATGAYLLAEQQLWRKGADEENAERGVFAFGLAGLGDSDVHEVEGQFITGLMCRGCFDARPDDSFGVLASWLLLNEDAGLDEDEVVVEALYKVQLTPWFGVTPDIQYVINPGGTSDVDNAVRGGARFELIF
ncbi:MAG: carbohydrate porin [Phycisphaerales bacterium]